MKTTDLNEPSFYIFATAITVIIISLLLICGCDITMRHTDDHKESAIKHFEIKGENRSKYDIKPFVINYTVVVIDGHEYIASEVNLDHWIVGPHKADCKYCKRR